MKNKVFFLLVSLSSIFSIDGQRYPHAYPNYNFLEQEQNIIDVFGTERWNSLLEKIHLQWTEGSQKVNIVHFGGSHIQADIWSNRMRQNFQNISPFNNTGRGMVFPFRVIHSNGSPYLKTENTGQWKGSRNAVRKHRPPFGLMGARADLLDSMAEIQIWENPNHCKDCVFDQIDLFVADTSKSYCVEITNDTLEWRKENDTTGVYTFKLSKPIDSLSLKITKQDTSPSVFSLYGFKLQNNNNGISYHSVGVNGASVPSYLKCQFLPIQLETIKPDLVIFSIGINDAYSPGFSKQKFIHNYDSLIQIVRNINPQAAILFTTNNDSYYKRKLPNKRGIVVKEAMYELAKKHNCSVWDLFEVMGGLNSISIWQKNGLAKKDKIHLTPDGYKLVGDLLFEAFLSSYKNYIINNG